MENFPPPESPDAAAAARAERIAALNARRAASHAPVAGNTPTTVPATAPTAPRKRRHPAQGARVAALGMSLATTGGLAALFAVTTPSSGNELQSASIVVAPAVDTVPVVSATVATAVVTPATNASANAAPATTPTTTPATTVAPAPVVVDGAVFHNKWGDVQVEATFTTDGTLIDVTALRTPDDRSKSVQINDYAVPRLTSQALTSQTAQVDTISGATYTSTDYRRSLQSAIDTAVQAGVIAATA